MTSNNVTIKELKFEVEIDKSTDFENVSAGISELSNKNLTKSLQKLFDNNFNPNENISIDSLIINIGEFDLNNKISLSKTICNLLLNKIKNLNKNNSKSNEYLITYFIKYGFLPWWVSSAKKMNDYLSVNSFNNDLKDELYQIIIKDNVSFYRLLNILNTKNKNKVLKKYLGNQFSYFQNSTLFFKNLLDFEPKASFSKITSDLHYKLFKALLKNNKENNIVFFTILKQSIHDLNIEWNKVSKSLLLKNNDNRSFSEVLNFNEDLFLSNKNPFSSDISDIGLLKNYILYGPKINSSILNTNSLTIILSRLLNHNRESLKIILSQLNVYLSPLKLFRISRLLNIHNLFNFISLLFDPSKSEFLANSFHFLKSLEQKGKIKAGTYFDFISIILQLKNSEKTTNYLFYKSLVKTVSQTYNFSDNEILIEFYFFSNSYKNIGEFKELIELCYRKIILKNTAEPNFFINEIEKSNKPVGFLTKYQITQFNLIKKHILYLNQNVANNSWSDYETDIFIFKKLSKKNIGSKNILVSILEAYSKENNLDTHYSIISILIKFYKTKTIQDIGSIELFEYILFLKNPIIFQKFSEKNQQFLITLMSDAKIKDKLELLSYNFNIKLSSKDSISNFDYFKNIEIKDSLIKEKIIYLINEYSQIFNGSIKSKINKNQLSQLLKLEIEKNSMNDRFIIYERVIYSISIVTDVETTKLSKQLLKRLVNKTNFDVYDIEFLNQINDSFFAFNNILKTTIRVTNDFYELLDRINDNSIKRVILNNYLLKSEIAVLKLSDKNYDSLMTDLSKNNNFVIILNNLLSYLPYQKRIELYSKLKFQALIIAKKKNLTENEFLLELLDQIKSMDSTTYRKVKEQINKSIKEINPNILSKKPFLKKDNINQIRELRENLAEKKRDYLLLELKTFNLSEKEFLQQKTIIEKNYKKELKTDNIFLEQEISELTNAPKDNINQIRELRENLAEKKRDYLLLELKTFNLSEKEFLQQKTIIEKNYKKELKTDNIFLEQEISELTNAPKDNKAHSVFLESSEDIIQNQMSSYNYMPSLKYVNTLSDKDFDYFLNLKKEIYIRKKLKFSNFEAYNNVEDIIESDENLLEFLNLYISDYEVLFEFAQNSFRNPVKNRLKDLIDNKNNILIQVENYFLKLQKETFFSTLNTSEFKIFIRVKILKTLVFTVYYKNQFNVSAFTMDLIETLSKNRNINYKQTAAIGWKSLANTILEKEIIKGIISYFDSNNFEPINKKIKDDEFLKNTIYFFLINKNIPSWSDYKMLGIDDVISFIKIKIKNSDSKYIKELLLDNKIAPTIISKLKNENISIQLEVLKTLEASSEKSFSIANFFEKINKFSEYSNFETTLIFEYIIKNNLWEKPSLIYVFNEIYPILKKNNLHKKTNIISNLLLNYPSLKLITDPTKQISENQKVELIRFYILNGTLTNIYATNSSIYFQLLRAYSSKNKNQLKILLLEFSNIKEVSKNFINISSKSILEDLIIDGLNEKNIELRFLFEKRIKSISTQDKYDIKIYDLIINNILAHKIIKLSNLIYVFNKIKDLNLVDYNSILKTGQKLVSNSKISDRNGVVFSFLKSIKKTNLSIDTDILNSDIKQIAFNNFIKELRYFVEFKSLNRLNQVLQTDKLYLSILKFRSNLILKKQLHGWSRQESKIKTLLKLFKDKDIILLINFIHPDLLDCVNVFNSILNSINYKPIQQYLNLNSDYKLTFKILNIWSKQNIIINDPSEIIFLLFEEVLAHPNIDSDELTQNIQNIQPSLNMIQKSLLSSILKRSINSYDINSIDIISDNSITEDIKDSIYITNAGMIIIWPFLSTLCSKLGLLEGKTFIDDHSLQKAVLMLHYIVFGDEKFEESNLILNKILCGVSPDFFVDTSLRLNEMEKSIGDQLLNAVTKNWEKLNNTSVKGLRESFLQRAGVIKKTENNYTLTVETKPFDLLLKTIPWNIMMIQTSFMDSRLLVEWKI